MKAVDTIGIARLVALPSKYDQKGGMTLCRTPDHASF
jgi:hypothetical protein